MFSMRFDMRIHPEGDAPDELYRSALEMCAWAEERGCAAVQVSEHHGSPDGFLPTPLLLASAIAARTRRLPIQVAALLVPLHDPIELAEQMAVLDVLSGGRVSYVCAIGYRPEEYAMFGRELEGRGRRLEECIGVLHQAFRGEPFVYEGRPVRVTPRPLRAEGPLLLLGGSSPAAVRRAARLGLGMMTQGGAAELEQLYRESCREAGNPPGLFLNPPLEGSVMSGFVARDPDRAWAEMGPFLLHDARIYAEWLGDGASATRSGARSVEALRAEAGSYRIFSVEEAIEHVRNTGMLMTQPLCGGLPARLAWPSLELLVDEVLPAVAARS